MRLNIRHHTAYRYEVPATRVVQAMRVWPGSDATQTVERWAVRVGGKLLKPRCRDGFGNEEATFGMEGPVESLEIEVAGTVRTRDCSGVVGFTDELLPPDYFLVASALTTADEALRDWALQQPPAEPLPRLHALMGRIRERVEFRTDATDAETRASEAFAQGYGVCQDHAHIMIASCHLLGLPARYVAGYLWVHDDDLSPASHAWCEVFVPDLGWVGFDVANRICPNEQYVRVAIGRDARDAAPVRGIRQGGAVESLNVTVQVQEAQQQ